MAKIDKSYHKLCENILKNGFKYEDPNRKNIFRYQIPHYQFVHDFKDGFPAITTKKLYWKGVVAELLWFLRGDTNIKYLIDNGINIWNKDAYNYYCNQCKIHNVDPCEYEKFITFMKHGKSDKLHFIPFKTNYKLGDLGRVYGGQWKNWNASFEDYIGLDPDDGTFYNEIYIDQISNLIKELKENPMGTRHIVTAWNPAELDNMALPPCHWSFEILVEPFTDNEKLSYLQKNNISSIEIPQYKFTLKWHQRSVDTFLG